jgi:protein-disulfide isomerase
MAIEIPFAWTKATVAAVFVAMAALLFAPLLGAAETAASVDEDRLVQKIKDAVIEEIRKDGFLGKELDAAIERYIEKQRAAEAHARAASRRAAQSLAKNVRRVSAGRDHVYGDPDAEVSLIEYSDFECPYCKRFHATAKQLVDGSDGRVNWVYRHYPLAFHNPGATLQAEASECAAELGGNDRFWKYADQIYARTRSNGRGFPAGALASLATEFGLDEDEFQACLDSGRHGARVQADLEEGASAGITGTPGNILLNNRTGEVRARAGAVSLATLQAEVAQLVTVPEQAKDRARP